MRGLPVALLAAAVGFAAPAMAQETDTQSSAIQIDGFEPMPFQARSILNLAEPDVLDHMQISAGVFTHRAGDLLVLSNSQNVLARAVGQQQRIEALAAMGFFGFLDFGVAVPSVIDQSSDELSFIGRDGAKLTGAALGDIRLSARMRLLNPRKGRLGLAVMATTWVPSGDAETFNSDGESRWEARVAAGWYHPTGLGLTANLARQWRPHRELYNYVSDDLYRWGLGLRIPTVVEPLTFFASLSGSALVDPEGEFFETRGMGAERPVELVGAAQFRLPGSFYLTAGGGRGMSRGVGAPAWRGFLALHFSGTRDLAAARRRRALAKVEEEQSSEPKESQSVATTAASEEAKVEVNTNSEATESAETASATEPDWEAEADEAFGPLDDVAVVGAEPEPAFPTVEVDEDRGVVPRSGESESGAQGEEDAEPADEPQKVAQIDTSFADELLVQDPKLTTDEDHDGIIANDACPTEAEDMDGYMDEDGCPDEDNDFDGIPDNLDRCPNEAEDVDGFQDTDGCVDDDEDGDGIADFADACPGEAEDRDGFEDQDGCPDPDNDGDGIADVDDKCIDQMETINAFQDDDGCPDDDPRVKIVAGKIEIDGEIAFVSGKAELRNRSLPLLDELADLIRANPQIQKILIEGYTDSSGSYETNLELSQARAEAVWDYLIMKGVSPDVLATRGYGELYPNNKNTSSRGRAANRRVEFRILKTSGEIVQ